MSYNSCQKIGNENGTPEIYPLAVIGMSCYLPDASSPTEFWSNLFQGHVSIRPMGEERFPSVFFNPKKGTTGRSYTNLAALVDYDHFCRDIVPKMEAEFRANGRSDSLLPSAPGHLLALYTALETFRSAHLDPFHLTDPSIGVFTGLVSANNSGEFSPSYPHVECFLDSLEELPEFASFSAKEIRSIRDDFLKLRDEPADYVMRRKEFLSEELPHHLIRLIQKSFGLTGAGFSFDSACSSSLLSLELARNYLKEGKISTALVGGMTFFASSGPVHFSSASSCSSKGAWPFDKRACGLVSGEGCVFALVKGLRQAIADGNEILGIVRGVGISSDGRGKSLWAPSSDGQQLAIERAFQDSGLASWDEVDYVEAHATSTSLGDATELTSLQRAMAGKVRSEKRFPITSVKSNIGHILEAAGMTSMIKVLLGMKNNTILHQTGFESPGENFDWTHSPFYVPTENIAWPVSDRPRIAVVEAFGIGGLNAQVVVEGPEGKDDALLHTPKSEDEKIPIAIIGIGCVLPEAFDVASFRKLLDAGKPVFSPIPKERKDNLFTKAQRQQADSLYHQFRGGFVNGYEYNWRRHRVPPKHIQFANPLQFMILGAVDEAIESGGYHSHLDKVSPKNVNGFETKVLDSETTATVVGTRTDSDFLLCLNMVVHLPIFERRLRDVLKERSLSPEQVDAAVSAFRDRIYREYPCLKDETGGFTISTLASRITKTYDLMGGGVTLDSGNTSSLAALENGVHLLRHHTHLKTVVCASGHRSMARPELESCDHKGQIPAEGAVAFLLKRLDDAQRDEDPILAVIRDVESVRLTNQGGQEIDEIVEGLAGRIDRSNRSVFLETVDDDSSDWGKHLSEKLEKTWSAAERTIAQDNEQSRCRSVRSLLGDLRPVAGAASVLRAVLQMEKAVADDNPIAVVSQIDNDGMFYQVTMERTCVPKVSQSTDASISKKVRTPFVQNSGSEKSPEEGKIVFLFPGQGSQYKGMLQPFLREVPESAPILHEMDRILTDLSFPTFDDLAVQNADLLGKDVFRTQLSLLAADVLVARTLEECGIFPDMTIGHSYGEYPSMVAAGIWPFKTAAQMTERRCRVICQSLANAENSGRCATGMLSTNAQADEIADLFRRVTPIVGEGSLFVSNRNSTDQTVISGTRDALERLAAELKKIKRAAIILSVPAAYHSPLVADVCPPLEKALEDIRFFLPTIPFLSSVSMRFEADPDVFRTNLVTQMTRPVDFVEMIRKAYREGGRYFIEVGPKNVLGRLTSKILADKIDTHYYYCDNGPKGTDRPLNFASVLSELKQVCNVRKADARSGRIRLDGSDLPPVKESVSSVATKNPTVSISKPATKNQSAVNNRPVFGKIGNLSSFTGSAWEIGFARGQADAGRIRRMLRRYADVAGTPTEKLLTPFVPVPPEETTTLFGQDGYEELLGMAEGAQVLPEALIRHNLSVFPQSRDHILGLMGNRAQEGCSHFAGFLADGEFVHGGNIDIAFSRIISNALYSEPVVRRLEGNIPSVSIVLTGLLGSRGGFNARGLVVTTCDLMDKDYITPPTNGLHRGIVLQTILDRCATPQEAVEFLRRNHFGGAKAIGLSDLISGRTWLVEYCGGDVRVCESPSFFGANHARLLQTRDGEAGVPGHSSVRFQRLAELLQPDTDGRFVLDSGTAFSVLRDTHDPSVKSDSGRIRYRTMNMILQPTNAFSWMIFRDKEILRFQRTESPVLIPGQDGVCEEYRLREILPELDVIPRPCVSPVASISAAHASMEAVQQPACDRFISAEELIKAVENRPKPEEEIQGQQRLTERYCDRLVRLQPLPETGKLPTTPILMIYETGNLLADILRKQIAQKGGRSVSFSVRTGSGTIKSCEQIQREIDSLYDAEAFYDVLILSSWNQPAPIQPTKEAWSRLREEAIAGPTLAVQQWYRRIRSDQKVASCRILAATRMGGDLGVNGKGEFPEDGALLGLLRSIRFETYITAHLAMKAAIVDHARDESCEAAAANLLRELGSNQEILDDTGYLNGERVAVRMIGETIQPAGSASKMPQESAGKRPVWLITGGCRGVTAELALGIGKHYGAKLHLIGSTELTDDPEWINLDAEGLKKLKQTLTRQALERGQKPANIWANVEKMIEVRHNLRRFAENQIEVVYHSCDLSVYEKAYEITSKILRDEEKIDVVLFGAGYEKSSLFEKLSEDTLRKTLDVKVTSAAAVLSAFGSRSPSKIIGMGSITGRFGSSGQVSYCLANTTLSQLMTNFAKTHPQCRSLLIHWHPWGEIGMAVRPESRAVIEASGIYFMSPAEGVRVFLEELDDGLQEPEICRTVWGYYQWFYRNLLPVFSDSALAELPRAVPQESNTIPQTSDTDGEGSEERENANSRETSVVIGKSDYLRGNSIEEILGQPQVCSETSPESIVRVGRFVPRLMETELLPEADDISAWKELFGDGAILTLGDGPVAKRLVTQLESAGLTVWRIVPTDVDQTEKLLPEYWNQHPFVTVIDLVNDDPEPTHLSDETWEKQMKPRLMLACRVIRQTVILARSSKYFSKLNFIAGIRMGGHFGLTDQDGFPSGGASSGLLKALRDEIHVKEGIYLPVKVVDHSLETAPEEVVRHLLSELKAEREAVNGKETQQETLIHPKAIHQPLVGNWSPFDLETCYFEEHRYVVRTIGLPRIETEKSRSAWFCSLAESEPKSGVWVLVGGLRGITNANAFRLAQELRPKKIWLVGSSPFEPVEEKYLRMSEEELAALRMEMTRESLRQKQSPIKRWNAFNRRLEMTRNQRKFSELGTDIEYRPCDTRYWKNIEELVRDIESTGDCVTGLVFGASWPGRDEAIDKADIQELENGLMTKTCGLAAFLSNLKDHPLRFVVGFSSVSGRFGGNGQICYTSQNDMSAKLIHVWNHRKPDCRFFCIQWGAWGDVGMASRPEIKGALSAAKASLFTVKTGVPLFMGEFYAGLPEPEVLFVSWDYYDRFQPNGISLPKRLKSSEQQPSSAAGSQAAKKRCVYIAGTNSESRLIREKLGLPEETDDEPTDERLQNAAVFVLATPRDAALIKVDCETRRFWRNERQKKTMRLFSRWLSLREAVSSDVLQSDCVMLLTFSDAKNPIGYDEAREYQSEVERCLGKVPVSRRPIVKTLTGSITEKPIAFVEKVLVFFNTGTIPETAVISEKNNPLLANFVQNDSDRSVSSAVTVDPSRDPFLVFHQLRGKPILPFILETEIFAQTAYKKFKNGSGKDGHFIELRNLKSVRGMVCTKSVPYRLAVHGHETDDGFLSMRLTGDYYNPQGKKINENCPYFSGQVRFNLTGTLQADPCPNTSTAKFKWTPEYPGPNPDGFYHGPVLQKLRCCHFVDSNKMVGDLVVPDRLELIGRDKPESCVLDAAVLDAAFWACGVLNGFNRPGHFVIPDTLECLRGEIGRLEAGNTAQVAVELAERIDLPLGYRQVVFRFVIYDATGKPVWSAERFRMTELQVPTN